MPLAPGGLGRRRRQPPQALPENNFEAPPASTEKERTGPRAHAARIRRVSRRATGASSGSQRRVSRRASSESCDAQPAHFLARKPARLPARLPARRPARLQARNWCVLRCASDAFTDEYSGRLEARSRHASAACEVFAL